MDYGDILLSLKDIEFNVNIYNIKYIQTELKTKVLEWDILNPDQLINLEINNKRRTSII